MLSVMGACVKYLGHGIPTGEVIFFRSLISVFVLAFIAYRTLGLRVLKTDNWRGHALRSLAGTTSMFCLFTALTMIPLADVTTISFTSPMFVTVLAMMFLGERIHVFRWTALGVGLVGVLIMVSPHLSLHGGDPTGVGIAMTSAMFTALAMIFLRSMSGVEHALTITFYFMLTSMMLSLLSLPWGWVMPGREQAIYLLLIGVIGAGGQLLVTLSYRYAEASTIAPLDYSSMIMSAALGYWVFNEVPTWQVWWGMPLVIASGLIIFWREYRLHLQRDQLRTT